jgi:enoyl-CoA hydratase/carnithine racemase
MKTLFVSQKNGVGTIQFNRPEKANSVNEKMVEELEHIIDWFDEEKLKVIVFRGNSDVFVSGGDIEQHQSLSGEQVYPELLRVGALLEKISRLDAVTIVAVQGKAIGGGCEIIASCDFCFASDSATFQFIQARLGIPTAWGGASRLMYKIGTKKALYLLLFAEQISSMDAERIGLVDAIFPDDEFDKSLMKFTKKLAELPMPVINTLKHIAHQVEDGLPASQIYPLEAKACSECWDLDKHQRAVKFILSPMMKAYQKIDT